MLVAASALVAVVVVLDRRSSVGAVVVLAFLAVAPGAALTRLLGFPATDERAVTLVVALGVSFAIDALVAEAMVYAHVWTPARALLALVAIVVALVGLEHARDRRSGAAHATGG